MSYSIVYDNQPEKFLEKIDKHIAKRIKDKIESTLTEIQFLRMQQQLSESMECLG